MKEFGQNCGPENFYFSTTPNFWANLGSDFTSQKMEHQLPPSITNNFNITSLNEAEIVNQLKLALLVSNQTYYDNEYNFVGSWCRSIETLVIENGMAAEDAAYLFGGDIDCQYHALCNWQHRKILGNRCPVYLDRETFTCLYPTPVGESVETVCPFFKLTAKDKIKSSASKSGPNLATTLQNLGLNFETSRSSQDQYSYGMYYPSNYLPYSLKFSNSKQKRQTHHKIKHTPFQLKRLEPYVKANMNNTIIHVCLETNGKYHWDFQDENGDKIKSLNFEQCNFKTRRDLERNKEDNFSQKLSYHILKIGSFISMFALRILFENLKASKKASN